MKGLCGFRSKTPLCISSLTTNDMVLYHALKRLELEKNQASPENLKLKERYTRILNKLFDEVRKQEGGSFSIIRDLLIREYKELPVLDPADYKLIH